MPTVSFQKPQRAPQGLNRVTSQGGGQVGAAISQVGGQVMKFAEEQADKLITQKAKVELSKAERTFRTRFQELSQEALREPDLDGAGLARRLDEAATLAEQEASSLVSTGRGKAAFAATREELLGSAQRQTAAQVFERSRQITVEQTIGEIDGWIDAGSVHGVNKANVNLTLGKIDDLIDNLVAQNFIEPSQAGSFKERKKNEFIVSLARADMNKDPQGFLNRMRDNDSLFKDLKADQAAQLEWQAQSRIDREKNKADIERYGNTLDFFEKVELEASPLVALGAGGEEGDESVIPMDVFVKHARELIDSVEDPGRKAVLSERLEATVREKQAKSKVRDFGNRVLSGRVSYDPSDSKQRAAFSNYLDEVESDPNYINATPDQKTEIKGRIISTLGSIPGRYEAEIGRGAFSSGQELVSAANLYDSIKGSISNEELSKIDQSARDVLSSVSDAIRAVPEADRAKVANSVASQARDLYGIDNKKYVADLSRKFFGGSRRLGRRPPAENVGEYVSDLYGEGAPVPVRAEYTDRFRRHFIEMDGNEEAARAATDAEMSRVFGLFGGEVRRDAPTAAYGLPPASAEADLAIYAKAKAAGGLSDDAVIDVVPISGTEGYGTTHYYIVGPGSGGEMTRLKGNDGEFLTWWPGKLKAENAAAVEEAAARTELLRAQARKREAAKLEEAERSIRQMDEVEAQLNVIFPGDGNANPGR